MYNNIDRKIKVLAKVIFWVGVIASVAIGIAMIVTGANMRRGGGLIMLGSGLLVGGSLCSWISSMLLYGYGTLIENTSNCAKLAKYASDDAPVELLVEEVEIVESTDSSPEEEKTDK
jgi:hypothetical protein